MSHIFISHSTLDKTAALELRDWLEVKDHTPFLDSHVQHGIAPGRDWAKELYRQLRRCQAVILLCSENSMKSLWCFAEIIHSESLGKPIFPVKIADCEVHGFLQRYQILDMTGAETRDAVHQRLERGLKEAGLDPTEEFALEKARPPYPGLLAFDEKDAGVYFGRDDEIQKGLDQLQRMRQFGGSRWLLILGGSGSGKSSFMRAGLLPRLRRQSSRWIVVPPFRPQQRPLKELASALSRAFRSYGEKITRREILKTLEAACDEEDTATRGEALGDLALDLQEAAGADDATVLLLIDQTEEILGEATLAEEQSEAAQFLELLSATVADESSRLMVMSTLRSDYLGAFQQQPAVSRLEVDSLQLGPLSDHGMLQVIRGPADKANLKLDEGLAELMAKATATQDALPLLAFTLRELWERYGDDNRLEIREYEELGGLEGSVARAAERAAEGTGSGADTSDSRLRDAFLALARLDEEGHFARRTVPWDRFEEDAQKLLQPFVEARLLVSRGDGTMRLVEVAHEAIFRSWDRLARWLDEGREFLLWRKRLAGRLEDWQHTERDDSALLRGPALDEARRWLRNHERQLDTDERAFVRRSVQVEDAELEREDRRQRTVRSRQLALQSHAQAEANHELALLLAIESARAITSIEAERALRACLLHPWQTRRLLLGHTDHVVHVEWHPSVDDPRLLSASLDGTAVIWNGDTGERLYDLTGHGAKVRHAAWSPAGDRVLTVSLDGTGRIWDAANGRELHVLEGHLAAVQHGAWTLDGARVVTASADKTARIWDAATGEPVGNPLRHDDFVRFVACCEDRFATAAFDRKIRVWNYDGTDEKVLEGHTHALRCLAWDHRGRYLASAGDDAEIMVWDPSRTEPKPHVLGQHDDYAVGLSWSPGDDQLLSVSRDGTASVWRILDAALMGYSLEQDSDDDPDHQMLLGHDGEVVVGAWNHDGTVVATSSLDGTARLWDPATGKNFAVLTGHEAGVLCVDFDAQGRLATASIDHTIRIWRPGAGSRRLDTANEVVWRTRWSKDGERLATGGRGGKVQLWNRNTHGVERELDVGADVLDFAWSPDDELLATASGDGVAMVWNAATGQRLARTSGHGSGVQGLRWHPQGRLLATWCNDSSPRVWDAESGGLLARLKGHTGWVRHVAWSPGGHHLLSTSLDGTVRLWDLDAPEKPEVLTGHSSASLHAAYSPDGSRIATAGSDRAVRLWDAQSLEVVHVLAAHDDWAWYVAWSDDGDQLVSAGRDGKAKVWCAETGELRARLEGHAGPVREARWSPGSKRLLTVSDDGTARLWSLDGEEIAVMSGHEAALTCGHWHPDGDLVATAAQDGTARVFFAGIGDLMQEAERRAVRNFSREEWSKYMDGEYRSTVEGPPEGPSTGTDEDSPPTAPRKTLAKEHQAVLGGIILVDSPWGDEVAAGMRAGAEEAGAYLVLKRHHFDFLQELEFMRQFIQMGVDGLVLVPQQEEESVYLHQRAHEAGMVTVNIAISLNHRDCARYVSAFYESDNNEIGYRTGSYLAEFARRNQLPSPLPIGIVQSSIYGVSYRRGRGFRAALSDAGLRWYEAASLQGILPDEAFESTRRILEKHPEVQVIWCDNSENTLGAIEAIRDVDREIFLFGTEMNPTVARAMLDPNHGLQAVASQVTFDMSRKAVHAAVNILKGEDTGHYHRILESVLYTRDQSDDALAFLSRYRRLGLA